MEPAPLRVEEHDAVGVLCWDRQHVRNALDPATIVEVAHRLQAEAKRGAWRAAVLTGAGDVAFSAGMDLKALAADRAGAGEAFVAWNAALDAADRLPVIAAVNGMAMGGGFEIAMRCDLIVAAEHADFGLPEVKAAMVPHGGALGFPTRVPLPTALEWALLGERVPASRLRELGVVNRVVPGPDVVPTAIALAQQLAEFDPAVVRSIRNGMWASARGGPAL